MLNYSKKGWSSHALISVSNVAVPYTIEYTKLYSLHGGYTRKGESGLYQKFYHFDQIMHAYMDEQGLENFNNTCRDTICTQCSYLFVL